MAILTSLRSGGTTSISQGTSIVRVLEAEVDIADFVTAGGVTTDSVEVFRLPAGTILLGLQAVVVTACSLGASPDIDIGDATTADLYVASASTLTAGTVLTQAVTTNPLKYYDSAGSIRMRIAGGTIATGLIRFVAVVAEAQRNTLAVPKVYTNV